MSSVFCYNEPMNIPIYKNIATQLIQHIDSGQYRIGTYLPTEIELSEKYAVSRATVRAAIAILEQQGLVTRKKKAGTKVEATSSHQPYQYDLNTITDLIYLGEQHLRKVLETNEVVVDVNLARQYELPAGEYFIEMKSFRLKGSIADSNEIFSFTQLYFPAIYKDAITQIQEQPSKLVALLIEEFSGKSISHIQQSIQCIVLDTELASILGIQNDTSNARLCIHRKYYSQDEALLLASSSIHTDENFAYNFNLYRK